MPCPVLTRILARALVRRAAPYPPPWYASPVKPPRPQPLHLLDPAHTDPARVKRERAKARELKQSGWWRQKIQAGLCHYCGKKFAPAELTLDHVIPIARGGGSTKANCVPACKSCNTDKKLQTPLDDAFAQLERERVERGACSEDPDSTDPSDSKDPTK